MVGVVYLMRNLFRRLSKPWGVEITTDDLTYELEVAYFPSLLRELRIKNIRGLFPNCQIILHSLLGRSATLGNRPPRQRADAKRIWPFRPGGTTPNIL